MTQFLHDDPIALRLRQLVREEAIFVRRLKNHLALFAALQRVGLDPTAARTTRAMADGRELQAIRAELCGRARRRFKLED